MARRAWRRGAQRAHFQQQALLRVHLHISAAVRRNAWSSEPSAGTSCPIGSGGATALRRVPPTRRHGADEVGGAVRQLHQMSSVHATCAKRAAMPRTSHDAASVASARATTPASPRGAAARWAAMPRTVARSNTTVLRTVRPSASERRDERSDEQRGHAGVKTEASTLSHAPDRRLERVAHALSITLRCERCARSSVRSVARSVVRLSCRPTVTASGAGRRAARGFRRKRIIAALVSVSSGSSLGVTVTHRPSSSAWMPIWATLGWRRKGRRSRRAVRA